MGLQLGAKAWDDKHPTMQRQLPTTKNYLAQNIDSPEPGQATDRGRYIEERGRVGEPLNQNMNPFKFTVYDIAKWSHPYNYRHGKK